MNSIDSNIESQANDAAILNVLMYLPFTADDNVSLQKVVDTLGKDYNQLTVDEQRQYEIVKNAVDNDSNLANMTIGNQSKYMTDPTYERGGLNAATFTDNKGNVIVAYRGTGSGEWIDNGEGVSGFETDTEQQIEARQYFDRIVEENNYDGQGVNIIVSGHSKGGNKAQYTTINSEYNYLIDKCYNFDGQGMSPEAVEMFIRRYGEENYHAAQNKMYGFYAENDFVNPLGVGIVPKDQRYYFASPIVVGIDDITKNHFPDGYFNEDGSFSAQTEQGNLSRLVQNFSEEVTLLPPEIRSCVANTIMAMMQGNERTVNGDFVTWKDFAIGIPVAVPILLADLLGTKNGWATIVDMVGASLNTVEEKYGVGAKWIAGVAVAVTAIVLSPIIIKAVGVAILINICEFAVQKIIEVGKTAINLTLKIIDAIEDFVDGVKDWFERIFGGGSRGAVYNSRIRVNTYRLRYYADRIAAINRRVVNLDKRLDSLYWEVDLNDLWSLLRADALTGHSWKLTRCINYLESAAAEFDRIEANLVGQIS